jgi:hypothetical protein
MTRRALVMVLAMVGAGVSAGCGSEAPPSAPARAPATRAVVVGATSAPRATRDPDAPAVTARQALERFATMYINWNYRTIADDRERLARLATGDASVSLQRAAARSRSDYELQTGKVSNSGAVIAISPQRGGDPGSWVIVTRERMGAAGTYDGLPAAYHVTIATAESVGDGWAVSHWEPQS